MDTHKFLKRWQEHTGLYLVGEPREDFLKECGQLLYLEPRYLDVALRTASKTGTYDLKYIEAVALNVRGAGNRQDNVIDFFKAHARRSSKP